MATSSLETMEIYFGRFLCAWRVFIGGEKGLLSFWLLIFFFNRLFGEGGWKNGKIRPIANLYFQALTGGIDNSLHNIALSNVCYHFLWKILINFSSVQESHKIDHIVFNDKTKPVIAKPDTVIVAFSFKFFEIPYFNDTHCFINFIYYPLYPFKKFFVLFSFF